MTRYFTVLISLKICNLFQLDEKDFMTYVEKHNLYGLFSKLLEELVENQIKDPKAFIVEKLLEQGYGTKDEQALHSRIVKMKKKNEELQKKLKK